MIYVIPIRNWPDEVFVRPPMSHVFLRIRPPRSHGEDPVSTYCLSPHPLDAPLIGDADLVSESILSRPLDWAGPIKQRPEWFTPTFHRAMWAA